MEYLKTKVMTASQEELHLMLYDGAIRFSEEAKTYLEEGDMEQAHNSLVRAQNIVLEMSSGLDHTVNPELCAKLSSLYNFVYHKFIQANLKHDPSEIDDALKILNYQRETWVLLMEKIASQQSSPVESAELPPHDEFAEVGGMISLSV